MWNFHRMLSSPSSSTTEVKKGPLMKRKKGFYSISVVAKMFSVHQQTIRMYEKEGLITPKRSEGNTRLFAEEDVDRLEEVIYLTHKLGVNLAGVEIILKLQKKIKRMQDEMNKLFQATEGEFDLESQQIKEDMKQHVERLAQIRKENITKKHENLIEITAPTVTERQPKSNIKKRVEKSSGKSTQLAVRPTVYEEDESDSNVQDIEIEYEKD